MALLSGLDVYCIQYLERDLASSGRESQEQPGSCTETAGQRGCGRTRRYCSCLTAILSRCMYVLSLCGSSPAGPPGDAHTNIKSASLNAFIYHLVGSYHTYNMLHKSIFYCKSHNNKFGLNNLIISYI